MWSTLPNDKKNVNVRITTADKPTNELTLINLLCVVWCADACLEIFIVNFLWESDALTDSIREIALKWLFLVINYIIK